MSISSSSPLKIYSGVSLLVAALFFLSGFGGLVYQILWMRELGLLFGTTAHAAATTAASFFLGLGAGSAFFGERSRLLRRPLLAYGFLELAVSVSALLYFGLFFLYQTVYPKVFHSLEEQTGILLLVKFLLAMVVLFPPAFFMGGTLPVISRFLTQAFQGNELGRRVPLFYGINTFGAAIGTLAAGFYLPRMIGITKSYMVAIGITTLVGIIAILLGRKQTVEQGIPNIKGPRSPLEIPKPILWLAFFSGFTTLALEVLWTRMFAQTLQNSVYSYAIILFTFLIALALGAWISSGLSRIFKQSSPRVLVWMLLIAGLLTFLSPTLFHKFGSDQGGLLGSSENWAEYLKLVFTAAGITIFPATVALGVIFPSLLHLSNSQNAEDSGRIVGRLAGINTFGAVLGSLAGGFLFLDLFGLWQSIRLIAVGYLILVFAFSGWNSSLREKFPLEAILAALTLLVGLSWVDPVSLPKVYYSPIKKKESVIEVREKSDATVAIIQRKDTIRMKVNNFYALGNSAATKSERFQAQLPLIVHPKPERVFCLGLGTGITAGGALQVNEVKHLTVTELLPSVVEASKDYFEPWVNGLHEDEKVKVIAEDGRNYLAATEEMYDVIIADLFLPWRSGVGSLYTVDHYQRAAKRLSTGGMYAQWLPLYQLTDLELSSITHSMRQVFPQISIWRGNFF